METQDIFGDIIHAYTDADALEDGTLVDIGSLSLVFERKLVNRITGTLFFEMRPFFPLPNFAELAAEDEELIDFDLEAFAKAITTKLAMVTGDGRIRKLPPDIWLVENDVEGWTLMYPSDY